MNFVDPQFLLALPLFLVVHAFLRGWPQKTWLLLASYCFYAWCSPEYTLLLLLSTLVDYFCSLYLENRAKKKWIVMLSLTFNLGLLAYFKYASFFWNTAIQPSVEALGWFCPEMKASLPPVGISFFTFQTMSYTLDVYRGQIPASRSFLSFATYVSMFPQLVAGPIVRAKDLLLQIDGRRKMTLDHFKEGAIRFSIGFVKKTCIADALAITLVDGTFAHVQDATPLALSLAMVAYSFQIYYDFSGYTDMAIGLGKMMGYDFPENFNHPYLSTSFSDFWNRWHISLSSWLRDYLYIPLGGNRCGKLRNMFNLMITMLLGGLWHGASVMFILWGALHGLALVLQRIYVQAIPLSRRNAVPHVIKVVMVFLLITLIWVPFRAERWLDITLFWSSPFHLKSDAIMLWFLNHPDQVVLIFLSITLHLWNGGLHSKLKWSAWPLPIKVVILSTMLFWLLSFYPQNTSVQPFIYFQF